VRTSSLLNKAQDLLNRVQSTRYAPIISSEKCTVNDQSLFRIKQDESSLCEASKVNEERMPGPAFSLSPEESDSTNFKIKDALSQTVSQSIPFVD
jgi:hypothetical protein